MSTKICSIQSLRKPLSNQSITNSLATDALIRVMREWPPCNPRSDEEETIAGLLHEAVGRR